LSAGRKVYSLHAPEVECIDKGKAHRPYEFGVKVSVATTVKHSAGGQFVTHAAALPGNPYDGHTLGTIIPQMQVHEAGAAPHWRRTFGTTVSDWAREQIADPALSAHQPCL
jgi:hypothetical protein